MTRDSSDQFVPNFGTMHKMINQTKRVCYCYLKKKNRKKERKDLTNKTRRNHQSIRKFELSYLILKDLDLDGIKVNQKFNNFD